MGLHLSKMVKNYQDGPKKPTPLQVDELLLKILSFCDDEELLAKSEINFRWQTLAKEILQQRLTDELVLFGITPENLELEGLSPQRLYQLRRLVFALENHDMFAAKQLESKAKKIHLLLKNVVNQAAPQGITAYLYSIFSALSEGRAPVFEQMPTFVSVVKNTNQKFLNRLTALSCFAQNNADCIDLFQTLAQQQDLVAHWYLYKIHCEGLCGQPKNSSLALSHLQQAAALNCVRMPEYAKTYLDSFKNFCLQSLRPLNLPPLRPSPIEQQILDLPQNLTEDEKAVFLQQLTIYQSSLTL